MAEKAKYVLRITLRSDLCAGNGESTGVTVDSDICTDDFGLPYIPARRIKGVLRAAAEQLSGYDRIKYTKEQIDAVFGTSSFPGSLRIRNAELSGVENMRMYLRNLRANQNDALHTAAKPMNVTRLFTSVRGQTRLEDGVAAEGSLRYTRVLNHYSPLKPGIETVLEAEAELEESDYQFLNDCCRATRYLGSHRNRGLGFISVTLRPKKETKGHFCPETLPDGEMLDISYTVALDAPVTLPGCLELLQEIPARSVIGCMAATLGADDPDFRALFLTGEVQWSALTPQVEALRTVPAPLMLTHLKNESKYANRFAESKETIDGKKQKTVNGAYAAQTPDGFVLAKVRSHAVYHHSMGADSTLYTQESLDAGMLYAGTVRAPGCYAEKILALLRTAQLAFGRSRTAQYAVCSLAAEPSIISVEHKAVEANRGEIIYAALQSDLVLMQDGLYVSDAESVRALLAKVLGVSAESVRERTDYCQFHTIAGYHAMWRLQKQQIPAVRGGSVFCFRAEQAELPREIHVGGMQQEGFGVCRILSETEMQKLRNIRKADVDSAYDGKTECSLLESALRKEEIRRVMSDTARDYEPEAAGARLETGILGRLRQMLVEAESEADLLARIDTIKSSDQDSENTVPRRDKAKKVVVGLYQNVRSALVCSGLQSADSQELPDDWKLPLEQLLHRLYYDAGRREAASAR